MIGTYASAALICLASLLVGRAIFTLAGRREWCWLEPAVGFAAIIAVSGLLARAPGHGTSATLAGVTWLASEIAIEIRFRVSFRDIVPLAITSSQAACRAPMRLAGSGFRRA